jgi:hypothetical protein
MQWTGVTTLKFTPPKIGKFSCGKKEKRKKNYTMDTALHSQDSPKGLCNLGRVKGVDIEATRVPEDI